jgi:hypothetical protein
MENIKEILLILHITGGSIGLITGFYNIINRKGSKIHRRNGLLYVLGMFLATLSGIALASIGENQFLFLIGVFSFYLAFTGYRSVLYKNVNYYRLLDKIVAGVTLIFALIMIVGGFYNIEEQRLVLNPVLVVFGLICLVYSTGDLMLFFGRRKAQKNHWLFNHIIRMMASYISAVTAFLVVNITFLPGLVIWLGPSVVGSVIISMFIRKYKQKLATNV